MITEQPQPYSYRALGQDRRVAQFDTFFLDILIFLIPAVLFAQIDAIGRLFVSELLLLAMLPLLLLRQGQLLRIQTVQRVLAFGVVWLLGQIVTDLIKETPFADYSRGWSKIGFLLTTFMALSMLLLNRGRKQILLFGFGLAVGLISLIVHPGANDSSSDSLWKMAPGQAASLAVALTLSTAWAQRFRSFAPLVMLLLAALNMVLLARNLSGTCFITAVYLGLQAVIRTRGIKRRDVPVRMQLLVVLVVCVSAGLLSSVYGGLASGGYLGEDARAKYKLQSENKYGILLGGRSEILVSSQAVFDSPIIGHGSWAKDRHYVALYVRLQKEANRAEDRPDKTIFTSGLIPSHSHLMGAWVESGICGAIFWVFVIVFIMGVARDCLFSNEAMSPAVAFCSLSFLWDILFSPFGAEQRIFVSYYLVLFIFVSRHLKAVPGLTAPQGQPVLSENVSVLTDPSA